MSIAHESPVAVAPRVLDLDDARRHSQRFRREGLTKVTELIGAPERAQVHAEAVRLLGAYAERRDIELATTDYTPRAMSVVPSAFVRGHASLVTRLYDDPGLREMLARIAAEPLFPCPSVDEEFLIARHERPGDTHGWHWGDYSFALIWVLEAPPPEVGGLLQAVPHTDWDKARPRIHQYLLENPIRTYHFASGDVYFLRTDTTLHRTTPLRCAATRIILNMTWASAADLQRPLQGDDRWWEDARAKAARARGAPEAPASSE